MHSSQNKLEVANLSHTFGSIEVLKDVSLTVSHNQFVSLMGISGSGKSTILNVVAGLIRPDSGRIIIDGQDFTGTTGRVSYMYQKDLLMPWRKVIDNVALPLVIKGDSKNSAREQVADLFAVFGLSGFEYHYPFQLSGGMRQRVALMRTYVFSKDIILLDEPFGGLDAITRNKMHAWLLETLAQLNTSVLLVTHDIEEALLLSDKIYVLSDRPAIINEILDVNIAKPRQPNVVTSSAFNALRQKILNELE